VSKLIVILCVLLFGCTQVANVGYFLIQAQSLTVEAEELEQVVSKARLTEEDQVAFDAAIRAIKLNVAEVKRYDALEEIAQVDLQKLERNYMVLRRNVSFIVSILSKEDVWSSFNEFERMELKAFYQELVRLDTEIMEFQENNEESLLRAAKITAFSSVAVKVLLKVAEVYL